jgi:ribosomal protein RSM22 (predicted rRNA methylase)
MQQFARRQFTLYAPEQLNAWLKELGFDLNKTAALAEQVLQLSNIYNSGRGSPDIWSNKGFIAAYLTYFQPLNYLRLQQVIADGIKVGFWQGLQQIVDYGAGLGTFAAALNNYDQRMTEIQNFISFEPNRQANEWHARLHGNRNEHWTHEKVLTESKFDLTRPTLLSFSYSLNEMINLPAAAENAEALLFLEPSTLSAGRRLQELRGHLLKKGFYAWAPCLHQQGCPLLVHSKRDWCHTRIHIEMPEWFLKLEQHLPMKNNSITYSYLLVRKTPPSKYSAQDFRVIGDTLFEKGKVRQAICQSEKRQFFSWLTKMGPAPTLPRGARVKVSSELVEKSDELRPQGKEFKFSLE